MKTEIYSMQTLNKAAEKLKKGEIVAFPTETVFGLGAIANSDQAIQEVYRVKGRPSDNPLIIHVSSIKSVEKYVDKVSPIAQKLMESFWPGPLTIIFPKSKGVFSEFATKGQNTVALRMPRQLETLLLIDMVGFPLVGPSANVSGKPSPTNVQHVLNDFEGTITGVIANNTELTEVGVESTVVLPTENSVIVLRPGAVTIPMLQDVVGVQVIEKSSQQQLSDNSVMSPGVKYTHYSPDKPVYLMSVTHALQDWKEFIQNTDQTIGLLASDDIIRACEQNVSIAYSLGQDNDVQTATQRLFDGLRYLEKAECDIILVQGYNPHQYDAHAYMNRLTKASDFVI